MARVDALTIVLLIVTALLIVTSLVLSARYYIEGFRAPPLPTEMVFKGRQQSEVMTHVRSAATKLRFRMLESARDEIVFKSMYQRFVPGPVIRVSFAESRDGLIVSLSSVDVGSYGWRAAAINAGRLVTELHRVINESASGFRHIPD